MGSVRRILRAVSASVVTVLVAVGCAGDGGANSLNLDDEMLVVALGDCVEFNLPDHRSSACVAGVGGSVMGPVGDQWLTGFAPAETAVITAGDLREDRFLDFAELKVFAIPYEPGVEITALNRDGLALYSYATDAAPDAGATVERVTLSKFSVSLEIPSGWSKSAEPSGSEDWAGDDGFVQVLGMSAGGGDLDAAAVDEAGHHLDPYGTSPTIEEIEVAGQPGRWIWPSADASPLGTSATTAFGYGAVLTAASNPLSPDETHFEFIVIIADVDHLRELAASLRWESAPNP